MNSILVPALADPPCQPLPLYATPVRAGFPSPATDYIECPIDLNALIVRDAAATFFLRVQGDSMRDAGILDGSLVAVEGGRQPQSGDIVVACLDGDFTLKRFHQGPRGCELRPANPDYPVIRIVPGDDLQVFGVVVAAITRFSV